MDSFTIPEQLQIKYSMVCCHCLHIYRVFNLVQCSHCLHSRTETCTCGPYNQQNMFLGRWNGTLVDGGLWKLSLDYVKRVAQDKKYQLEVAFARLRWAAISGLCLPNTPSRHTPSISRAVKRILDAHTEAKNAAQRAALEYDGCKSFLDTMMSELRRASQADEPHSDSGLKE